MLATRLVVAGLLVTPSSRAPILLCFGRLLIADESPTARVDVVVVAVDAGAAGLLEAADLAHGGAATRVAAFAARPRRVELEFLARGVAFEDREALYRRQLNALGVLSVIPIPRVAGTEDQGRVLPSWCDEHGWTSVMVVTSWHHSRRLQRVLKRAMEGHPTAVQVRVARYSDFDPDNWWQDRDGVRTVLVESQKLLIDLVRHPFS